MADVASIEMQAGQGKKGITDLISVLALVRKESPESFRERMDEAVAQIGIFGLVPNGAEKAKDILRKFIEPFIDETHTRLRERTPWVLAQFALISPF